MCWCRRRHSQQLALLPLAQLRVIFFQKIKFHRQLPDLRMQLLPFHIEAITTHASFPPKDLSNTLLECLFQSVTCVGWMVAPSCFEEAFGLLWKLPWEQCRLSGDTN